MNNTFGRIIGGQNNSENTAACWGKLFGHPIIAASLPSLRASLTLCLPILLLAVSGCGTLGGKTPDWVANPKAVYPEAQYLVAVGEGDTRRAAENAAAANLARIFEAHIESDERLIDQTRETGKTFERTTDFTADISILSAQTLHNIQHAEAWRDKLGRVHAVAYLNRRETAGIYRSNINEQTTRIQFLLSQAEQNDDLLKKFATLRAAARAATENGLLLRQLKVIHPPSATSATPGYSENNIRKALADTAKQIRVQIKVDGDDDKRMTSVIEDLITRYGFVVGSPAVLKIDGRVVVNDTGQRTADLVFVRYDLVVQIKDNSGTLLASVNDKGREGHISLAEARVRSFRTLETAIQSSGGQRLDAYFDSLIDQIPQ
jgi:hypothetical protein